MRKRISVVLILAMLASLCACTATDPNEPETDVQGTSANNTAVVQPTEPDAVPAGDPTAEPTAEPAAEATEEPVVDQGGYFAFVAEGVELIPGQAFDASALPQAEFTYQVPSCAFEGTDNVYSYGGYEITACDEGNGEFIYSVYLIDPNLTTPEGLALGDPAERITELYGQNYTENGTQMEYRRGDTLLCIILQNDFVASIEYLMAQ